MACSLPLSPHRAQLSLLTCAQAGQGEVVPVGLSREPEECTLVSRVIGRAEGLHLQTGVSWECSGWFRGH